LSAEGQQAMLRRVRAFYGYFLGSIVVLLGPSSAWANDAGLTEIAGAVRYAELHFERDPDSAQRALAAMERAPELTRESLAVRYAKGRVLERLGRNEDALASYPSEAEAQKSAAELGERVARDMRLRRARVLAALLRCEEALLMLSALESERAFPIGVLKSARGKCAPPTEPVKPPEPLTLEQRLSRADKLTEQGRGEEALAIIDGLSKGKDRVAIPKTLKARVAHLRGMALFRMRTRYPEAARVLEAASRMASATAEDDAFHAARAIARSDHNVLAAKAMRAFAKRFPKSKRVSEALYLAAWLELRVDHKGAERALGSWLESPHAQLEPGLAAEARAELGMRALREGKHALAAQRFAAYAAVTEGCLERGRGMYWGARAELAQGNKAQAIVQLVEATSTEPLCWYALLARNALRDLGEPLPAAYPREVPIAVPQAQATADAAVAPDAATEMAAPTPEEVSAGPARVEGSAQVAVAWPRAVAFYAALGFDTDAVNALRADEGTVRATAPVGMELQALIHAYTALGEHARPRALVHQAPAGLLLRAPTPQTAFAMRAAYARPHRELVRELAASEQVDEDLIYAVMLKESAFNPHVVSNADAIGLMQLLPSTGKLVGKELGIAVTRETLLDPHDNIRLGVRLLRQLMSRYRGQMALAAAAYNAGAHRVDEWLKRAARAPAKDDAFALDRFVDDIPIDQTRNYVRRVLAFHARYRYLGPDGLGTGPVPELPSHVQPR
jgi:soluble lytic murein transglycosylase